MVDNVNSNPLEGIQPLPGESIEFRTPGDDPSQEMPTKKDVLDQITSSKAFGIAKFAGKIAVGSVGIGLLIAVAPIQQFAVMTMGMGAPFGAHIVMKNENGEPIKDQYGKIKKLDSLDIADFIYDGYFMGFQKIIEWIKPPETNPDGSEIKFEDGPGAGGEIRFEEGQPGQPLPGPLGVNVPQQKKEVDEDEEEDEISHLGENTSKKTDSTHSTTGPESRKTPQEEIEKNRRKTLMNNNGIVNPNNNNNNNTNLPTDDEKDSDHSKT